MFSCAYSFTRLSSLLVTATTTVLGFGLSRYASKGSASSAGMVPSSRTNTRRRAAIIGRVCASETMSTPWRRSSETRRDIAAVADSEMRLIRAASFIA